MKCNLCIHNLSILESKVGSLTTHEECGAILHPFLPRPHRVWQSHKRQTDRLALLPFLRPDLVVLVVTGVSDMISSCFPTSFMIICLCCCDTLLVWALEDPPWGCANLYYTSMSREEVKPDRGMLMYLGCHTFWSLWHASSWWEWMDGHYMDDHQKHHSDTNRCTYQLLLGERTAWRIKSPPGSSVECLRRKMPWSHVGLWSKSSMACTSDFLRFGWHTQSDVRKS